MDTIKTTTGDTFTLTHSTNKQGEKVLTLEMVIDNTIEGIELTKLEAFNLAVALTDAAQKM